MPSFFLRGYLALSVALVVSPITYSDQVSDKATPLADDNLSAVSVVRPGPNRRPLPAEDIRCEIEWNDLVKSPEKVFGEDQVAEKTSLLVHQDNLLAGSNKWVRKEGVILKNGKATLRGGEGGSLRLYHGNIPVWYSKGPHYNLSLSSSEETYIHFSGLSSQLLDDPVTGVSIVKLTLTDTGNLQAFDATDNQVWASNTYMADGNRVLSDGLFERNAPASISRPDASLFWNTKLASGMLLKNGDHRMSWEERKLRLYKSNQLAWEPRVSGSPVWQGSATLSIYDGNVTSAWTSENWFQDVVVGERLGLTSKGELMITDRLGCVVWEATPSKDRTWATLPSRKAICKEILTLKENNQWWHRKDRPPISYGCPKSLAE